MNRSLAKLSLLLLALGSIAFAQNDVVLKAMRDEMARSTTDLHLPDMEKPYYIEYRVDDETNTTISATLGVLSNKNTQRSRSLHVQVRVGDHTFDNTNFLAMRRFGPSAMLEGTRTLPIDDDYNEIRRAIWLTTDAVYKRSASTIVTKRSILQQRKSSTNLADFTPQKPVTLNDPRTDLNVDQPAIEKLVRDVSAVFRNTPDIVASEVQLNIHSAYSRYINSEGSSVLRSEPLVRLEVEAHGRAADGLPLEDSFSVYGRSTDVLRYAELVDRASKMANRLVKMSDAAELDRYSGPMLFDGEAAGAVLADVFSPAVAASRFPITDEPQFENGVQQMMTQMGGTTLTEKLGGRVMPDYIDVTDNPLLPTFNGVTLLGTRNIDDEAVPTRELPIVQAGILMNIVATRTPTPETKVSTGSKGLFGANTSNLILTARKSATADELRQQLLKLAKARGYDYGIVVRHAREGSLTWIARFAGSMGAPGVPTSASLELYKVFADGHEQPIRGVDISSLTAASFKDIVAVGDKPFVYNTPHIPMLNAIFGGFGAGSSMSASAVLGSFITPSILFEEVSLKKSNTPTPNPPVVPSPLPSFTQR